MSAKPEPESDRELVSTRLLDFRRALVFKAFSDPVALAVWWGPAGFSNTFQEFEFRPGGVWRFVMHGPDGNDFENESVFLEVAAPERIRIPSPPADARVRDDDTAGARRTAELGSPGEWSSTRSRNASACGRSSSRQTSRTSTGSRRTFRRAIEHSRVSPAACGTRDQSCSFALSSADRVRPAVARLP